MTRTARPVARRPRWRVGVGAVVVILLVALGIAVLVASLAPRGGSVVVEPSAPAVASTIGDPVFVHVLGSVVEPGLYQLNEGARVVDAIAAAGGFLDEADQAAVNLARLVTDGEQLVVPVVGAAPVAGAAAAPGKVNLNTADAATLEGLPNIGPATAQRIIEWREANGRFVVVEDLLSVSGIGDKTFDELEDLVTV